MSSNKRLFTVIAGTIMLGLSLASAARAQDKLSVECERARLSAWFERQRQLDIDPNPFLKPKTPVECMAAPSSADKTANGDEAPRDASMDRKAIVQATSAGGQKE